MKGKVLVVEDDIHLLSGIRDILELEKYTVLTAQNGQQGLEVLRSDPDRPPDLIVSDIMMPYMDGFQFLQEIRKEDRFVKIPFIFLTAKGEKTDVNYGKRLGVDDYLTKPFDADDLLVAVASRLDRLRRIKEVQDIEVSTVKSNVLTILNHEFRTPLTLVVAYAEMLKEVNTTDMSSDELLSFLRGINSGAERLRRLIENFILLVELETGDIVKNYGWRMHKLGNLDAIIQQAHKQIFSGDNAHHHCEFFIKPNLPLLFGDPEFLMMAVRELMDNAIKFSKNKATEAPVTVKVGAQADDQFMYIWVQDFGRGIPEHEFENIWKPFYQIDRTTFEDQGAGSGLAIVRGVVDLHHGRTELVSEIGRGSTFTLILPLDPPENRS